MAYQGIYTSYHSSTQYRVYDPRNNQFEWPTNVHFYENRKGVQLMTLTSFPITYNSMRADIAPTRWNGNDLSDAFIQDSIETVSSDDDEEEDYERPTPNITPSPRIEEIKDIRDLSVTQHSLTLVLIRPSH
ncbi:hypothetical protein HO173_004088 [Letharia columbiana]|uniref:Uncharacterized protein n=1 Tax=Letharia columbiana TaxID=112416 RepID=A0A8H6FZT3_9LECA|nr:uncharacterized protein HO173_004088 [Letharia columbiana]KAF6237887.1 hypothetical protein HO173_004088 [Letharia columbiana]